MYKNTNNYDLWDNLYKLIGKKKHLHLWSRPTLANSNWIEINRVELLLHEVSAGFVQNE